MKFTYTQKKWAMTGVLLAVLGFNVSMNKHSDGIASADFASESGDLVESKIVTADGVFNVKYIKSGENEVMAVIPKVTEGKTCDVCGTTYTLDASLEKNKSNIDELNVQLLKQIAKAKPTQEVVRPAVAPVATLKSLATEERPLSAEEKVEKDLAAIKRRAGDSPSSVAKELGSYFEKHSKEHLPSKQMSQFILKEIIVPMDSEIERSSKGAYQDVKNGITNQYSAQNQVMLVHEEMFNATSELISSISAKNKDVRETTIKMVGALYSSENEKVTKVEDLGEKLWRLNGLKELNSTIFNKNRIAFQALSEKESTDWANSYTNLLVDTMTKIDSQYNQGQQFGQVQPAPSATQGSVPGARGGATRDGAQVTSGGTTALPAPSSIRSAGAPGVIAAPLQGVPTAPVGMTGYQLQTQSAQDALAPRVQLAPRGY